MQRGSTGRGGISRGSWLARRAMSWSSGLMRDPAPASVNKDGFWHQPPASIQPPVCTCAHIHTHVSPFIKTCIHIYYICMQVEKENSQLLKMIVHSPLTFLISVAFPQNTSSLSTPRCWGYPKFKALSPVLSFWIQSFSGRQSAFSILPTSNFSPSFLRDQMILSLF